MKDLCRMRILQISRSFLALAARVKGTSRNQRVPDSGPKDVG